jgi:hypothetical protein
MVFIFDEKGSYDDNATNQQEVVKRKKIYLKTKMCNQAAAK